MRNFAIRGMTTAVIMAMSMQAMAADFVVSDYQFVGLNRVTTDSLELLLPAKGSVIDEEKLADSIRKLYATEQFSDVQATVDGGVVRYTVVERPVIAEVTFVGNKLIPKQGLEDGLKQAGLAQGQVLKQATLHAIATELQNQYIMQGYYNSDIKVEQTVLDGNRVKLEVRFIEGKPAKVVDINIIGNEYFSDEDIKDALTLKEKSWNFLSKNNRYAQEKFAASLEALRSLYLNNGFVRMEIENANLNINEEKDSVFIEIKVKEGERYKFGETRFLGAPNYPVNELQEKITYKQGVGYTQKSLDETTQALSAKYGDDGFYNAQIRPVPRIDDATKIVNIDYYIDPARPVTVRRINFSGNIKTKDEVLRREMRQLEGTLASRHKIQLSQVRLMRTGYFKDVKVETKPVAGVPDQIDVNYIVEEQASGSTTAAVGYSQSGGVTFQLGISQNNFMGTGNRMNADFSRSETRDVYSLGYTDPYFTVDGVSQSLSAYYRKTKYDSRNISNYVLDSYGASASYGYPIDENQRISGGIAIDQTKVRGGRWMAISNVNELMEDGGTATFYDDGATAFENKYLTYSALLGWSYSSLDKPVFPNKGMSHNVDLTLGFGDATYQKLVYRGNYYHPFIKGSVLRGYTKLGYGNNLPFYENFYAGGYGSVRGYEPSSLGPQSQAYAYLANGQRSVIGEKVGGNALATFGAELILPMPFKGDWTDQVRPAIFVEGGQVFDTTGLSNRTVDVRTINPALTNTLNDSNAVVSLINKDNELRYSAGVGVTWYTPIGPISISYAQPFGNKAGDETNKVQFQIGGVF